MNKLTSLLLCVFILGTATQWHGVSGKSALGYAPCVFTYGLTSAINYKVPGGTYPVAFGAPWDISLCGAASCKTTVDCSACQHQAAPVSDYCAAYDLSDATVSALPSKYVGTGTIGFQLTARGSSSGCGTSRTTNINVLCSKASNDNSTFLYIGENPTCTFTFEAYVPDCTVTDVPDVVLVQQTPNSLGIRIVNYYVYLNRGLGDPKYTIYMNGKKVYYGQDTIVLVENLAAGKKYKTQVIAEYGNINSNMSQPQIFQTLQDGNDITMESTNNRHSVKDLGSGVAVGLIVGFVISAIIVFVIIKKFPHVIPVK